MSLKAPYSPGLLEVRVARARYYYRRSQVFAELAHHLILGADGARPRGDPAPVWAVSSSRDTRDTRASRVRQRWRKKRSAGLAGGAAFFLGTNLLVECGERGTCER